MAKHDFSDLVAHYSEIIQDMGERFTSHQFILALAQKHQNLYIKALCDYSNVAAPFRTVHGILAKRLHGHPEVELVHYGVPSENIFRRSSRCAEWRRLK